MSSANVIYQKCHWNSTFSLDGRRWNKMIQAATGFELSFPLNQLQLTCSSYWQATERDFLIASASIYQLIHCDVAWHANEICNRLKTNNGFGINISGDAIFLHLFESVACIENISSAQNVCTPIGIHINVSAALADDVVSQKEKNIAFMKRKEKQCQLYDFELIAFTSANVRVRVNHFVCASCVNPDCRGNRMNDACCFI